MRLFLLCLIEKLVNVVGVSHNEKNKKINFISVFPKILNNKYVYRQY